MHFFSYSFKVGWKMPGTIFSIHIVVTRLADNFLAFKICWNMWVILTFPVKITPFLQLEKSNPQKCPKQKGVFLVQMTKCDLWKKSITELYRSFTIGLQHYVTMNLLTLNLDNLQFISLKPVFIDICLLILQAKCCGNNFHTWWSGELIVAVCNKREMG